MAQPRVDDLLRRLLVQCAPEQAATAAEIATGYRSGLVLTGPKPRHTVRHLRRIGYTGPILCDAGRYSGNHPLRAGAGLRGAWTAEQHDLGLVALTDSGFLSPGDWPGLHRLLADARGHPPPLLVTLPLGAGWFAVPAWIDRLVATLNNARLPVAVAVVGDSFGTRYVTRGLVRLLTVTVPVVLLRSDIGALGAVCHGAHAGALATTSGLFVPALLGHHRPAVLARIVERTPDMADRWPCDCPECGGEVPGDLSPEGIYRHSLHAQLALGDRLLSAPHDVTAMTRAWRVQCEQALAVHEEIADLMPPWPVPPALRWWRDVQPPPLGASVPRQNSYDAADRRERIDRRTS
ncbi:hypothetical protein [Actinophytocola sp. KF-1]